MFPAPVTVLVNTLLIQLLAMPALAANRGADGNFDQRRSIHFRLLQDVDIDHVTGPNGSRAFERAVLKELESAYDRVRRTLDLRPGQDVKVLIYDPDVFEQTFAKRFRFNAAGFYDSASHMIHIRGDLRVDQALVRTLYHEYFHAALDAVFGRRVVPAWLNEGLAQWFENAAIGKRRLSQGEFLYLTQANHNGSWLSLAELSTPSFARLAGDDAHRAYLQSYAMVTYLITQKGQPRMRSFMRRYSRGGTLATLVHREFRLSLTELNKQVRAQFR